MKYLTLLSLTLLFSLKGFCQNITAITTNGRTVILKADKTWDYSNESLSEMNSCSLDSNIIEYISDRKIYSQLKTQGATIEDLKKHISIDMGCKISEIKILDASEQLGNAIYIVCVCGKKVKYRRIGTVFFKDGEIPFKQ